MMARADANSPPFDIPLSASDYVGLCARSLTANGFCVLRGPIVTRAACDYCAGAIWQRLDQLMSAAFAKGLDVDKGLLRFNEISFHRTHVQACRVCFSCQLPVISVAAII